MSFIPDVSKQVQEVVFFFFLLEDYQQSLRCIFNNVLIKKEPSQKHLCLFMDKNFNSSDHIDEKSLKIKISIC